MPLLKESVKLCALRALVPHVPHVPHALRALVSLSQRAVVFHVRRVQRALMLHVSHTLLLGPE